MLVQAKFSADARFQGDLQLNPSYRHLSFKPHFGQRENAGKMAHKDSVRLYSKATRAHDADQSRDVGRVLVNT